MRAVRVCLVCALSAAALVALPTHGVASWGDAADETHGAQLISADYERLEQGDDTTNFAAISADGRYVAIQTRARNFFAEDDPDPQGQYRAGGSFASICRPERWRRWPTAIC